jgi:hypothetical protein
LHWLLLVIVAVQIVLLAPVRRARGLARTLRAARVGRELWAGELDRGSTVLHLDGGDPVTLDVRAAVFFGVPEERPCVRVTVLGDRTRDAAAAYRASTSRIVARWVFAGDVTRATELARVHERFALRRCLVFSVLLVLPLANALLVW